MKMYPSSLKERRLGGEAPYKHSLVYQSCGKYLITTRTYLMII